MIEPFAYANSRDRGQDYTLPRVFDYRELNCRCLNRSYCISFLTIQAINFCMDFEDFPPYSERHRCTGHRVKSRYINK